MSNNFEESRMSLKNALYKGDFCRAREKINDNLILISSNLKDLQDYSLKIGSKADTKSNTDKTDKIIATTGEIFQETFSFIKDVSDFKYANRNEKIDNVKRMKDYENKLNSYKKRFEDLTNKIKRQNLQILDSARNSFRRSSMRGGDETSGHISFQSNQPNVFFMNGREYLDGVEEKEKQVNLIVKVTNQLNEISKQQAEIVMKSGETIQTIEENIHATDTNIKSAVGEMKQAKEVSSSSGGLLNKAIWIVLIIVIVLVFFSFIMPK